MNKRIELLAGRKQSDVLNRQCDLAEEHDTIKEAKARLRMVPNGKGKRERYLFSKSYQDLIEASEPLGYAQIVVDGECLYDYFAKGYNGELDKEEVQ
jgi:hypothetical protein